MADEFNWKEDKDSVVFPSTQGVAVYANGQGEIVIRQQAGPLDDDDSFVVIPRDQVAAVILAIQAVGGEI